MNNSFPKFPNYRQIGKSLLSMYGQKKFRDDYYESINLTPNLNDLWIRFLKTKKKELYTRYINKKSYDKFKERHKIKRLK